MNNSESAKRGFKTFILTLSISLMVFSAIYYALTTYNPVKNSSEEKVEAVNTAGLSESDSSREAATVVVTKTNETPSVQGAKDQKTVFGAAIKNKPTTRPQEVLAGATSAPQTTQSVTPVPSTGFTEMTLGLLLSLGLFIGAMAYNFLNPRKLALSNFEKKIIKKSK
jgi:hypothetical protein